MTTTKAYDKINRLTSINHANGANTLASYAYGYNAANQRTNVTYADDSFWTFGYDSLGQVNSGKRRSSSGSLFAGLQYEYEFDDIGNRSLTRSGGDTNGAGLRTANYSPNLLNQYTSRDIPPYVEVHGEAATNATVTVNNLPTARRGKRFRAEVPADNSAGMITESLTNIAVLKNAGPASQDIVDTQIGSVLVPASPETFTYDLDGNTLADGRWTNTWNGENRLIQIESHASVPDEYKRKLVFTYDHQGRRTSKKAYLWNSGNWLLNSDLTFLYDGWNLIAELTPTNTLIRSYQWGLDLSGTGQGAGGVGGVLFFTDHSDATTHAYAHDGNGNVTTLASAADSSISASYEYAPFGQTIKATGSKAATNPIRFSTKYEDEATELVYYGLRFYNPDSGRWLNRDRIMEEGGLNLNGFVENCPSSVIDPFGLAPHYVANAITHGQLRINAFDKTFPTSQTTEFRTWWSGTVLWKVRGGLRIVGPNNERTVRVYPTRASGRVRDSTVLVYQCRFGRFEYSRRRVTILRPYRMERPRMVPTITALVYNQHFRWTLYDQFRRPLPGWPMREWVNETLNTGFIDIGREDGGGTTEADGTITDTYNGTATSRSAVRVFTQLFRAGVNWHTTHLSTRWEISVTAGAAGHTIPRAVMYFF